MKFYQRKATRLALLFAVIAALAGLQFQSVGMASQVQDRYIEHTKQCIDWFFNNPARHAARCVDPQAPQPNSPPLGSQTGGGAAPVTTTPTYDPCASAGSAGNSGCVESHLVAPLLKGLFDALTGRSESA